MRALLAKSHAAALAVPALIATVSAFQVVTQFREDFGVTRGKQLGTALRPQGEVLKRSSRSFRWYNVAESEDLVEKTSIRTSGESRVSLQFRDGSSLDLGPQSLVVLGGAGEKVPRLKVMRGRVAFKAKGPMRIEAAGKTLEASAGAGQVEVLHGAAKTTVEEGSATLLRSDAAPIAMAAGSTALVDVEGTLTAKALPPPAVAPIQVSPPSPSPTKATRSGDFEVFPYAVQGGHKFSTRLNGAQSLKSIKIEFSWMPLEGAREYRLQFYDLKKRPTLSKSTQGTSLTIEIRSPAAFDRYYRIFAKKEDREYRSELLRYSVELAAPSPVNPANGQRWEGGVLTWESTLMTEAYELQVSKDRTFRSAETQTAAVNFANVRPSSKGTYYWRVRSIVAGRASPWSEAWQFIRP